MGKSNSKPETTAGDDSHAVNNGIVESESGGFHLVELHMPTVGAGIFFFIFVAAAAALFLWIRRKCRKGHFSRRRQQPVANPFEMFSSPQAFRPVLMPDPSGMMHLQAAALQPRNLALPSPYVRPFDPAPQRYEPGRIEEEPREHTTNAVVHPAPRQHRHPLPRRPTPAARATDDDQDVVVI